MDTSDYLNGFLPSFCTGYIDAHPTSLNGSWEELYKQREVMSAIFGRLGLGGIKRRLVTSRANQTDLQLLSPVDGSESSMCPLETTEVVMTLFEEAESESPSVSTQPTSPMRDPDSADKTKGQNTHSCKVYRWKQKQYLPMGRFLEDEFQTNNEEKVNVDADTGPWISKAVWMKGVLYQKRYSEKHNVTLFESRCVIKGDFDLSQLGLDEKALIVAEPVDHKTPRQLFQWKLVDHKDNEREQVCYCVLYKIKKQETDERAE